MSRNFYIAAATLGLFAILAGVVSLIPSSSLPANAALWRSVATFLLLMGLASALGGVMTHLFEQVDRRSQAARTAARLKRRPSPKA
jgi:hypothetical protein